MNVILYARFSPRPNSAECDSVSKQLEEMREYCKRNGHAVCGEFYDEAMSGNDADRPGLWDAIYALKKDYTLLIRSWDRLARDSYLAEIIQMQVKKKGCSILAITQEDTSKDNPESKLIRTILLAIAEYQRQIIRARTRAAMRRFQAEGRRMTSKFRLPYGQRLDPNNPKRMIPDTGEQAVIVHILALKQTGLSYRAITKKLAAEGIAPRMKRRKWKGKYVDCKGKWGHCLIRAILRRACADSNLNKNQVLHYV